MDEEAESKKAAILAFINEEEQNFELVFTAMLDAIIIKSTKGKFKDFHSFAATIKFFPHRKHGSSTATFNDLDKILIARLRLTQTEATIVIDELCKQQYIYYNDKDKQFWFYQ